LTVTATLSQSLENHRDTVDRNAVLKELQSLADEIRNHHPSLTNFLKTPSTEFFYRLSEDGPIVVLISSQYGNYAITLKKADIKAIKLEYPSSHPNVTLQGVGTVFARIVRGSAKTFPRRNASFAGALAWMWEYFAEPVCNALDLKPIRPAGTDADLPPRLWWIPTGLFARLPVHAAGYRVADCDMFTRAFSSYAASFRMLAFTRAMAEKNVGLKAAKGLLVSMPVDDEDDNQKQGIFLRGVKREAERILKKSINVDWTLKERPSADEVQTLLSDFNILHAACHGTADPKDPFQSCLKLFNQRTAQPTDVMNVDKLTVARVSNVTTSNSILAFLRACSTRETIRSDLLDEGLDVATAFQVAGFPHVIGTLWPAYNSVSSKLAESFYERLSQFPEGGPLSNHNIALAFLMSTNPRELDADGLPLKWAAFIHQGP